jgi:hypothetical protein
VGKFSEEPGLCDGVGMIDYHVYTVIYFPTEVVDYGRDSEYNAT